MVSNRPSTPSAKSQTARSDSAANINSTNTSINLVPPPIPPNRETSQTRGGGTLNFLRRSKSGERQNEKARRSISGTRLLKKNHKDMLAEQERQRLAEQSAVPKVPPVLPGLYDDGERRVAPLPTFGGENARPGSHQPVVGARSSSRGGVGPGGLTVDRTNQQYKNQMAQNMPFDPYARSESMTHRGRYSYASSAISTLNSPRRVRRRKDPTPFK